MTGKAETSDWFLPLTTETRSGPKYAWLFRAFQQAILTGRLAPGTKLPASRALAEELKVSRNTVKTAYEMLQAEGFLNTRHGSGSYVSEKLPDLSSIASASSEATINAEPPSLSSLFEEIQNTRPLKHRLPGVLAPGSPCLQSFPWKIWQRHMAQASRRIQWESKLDVQGHEELRQQIAHHLNMTRGMHCSPAQILVCSGSQQALYLALKAVLNPNDKVLTEEPGYEGVEGAIAACGGIKVPVPGDEHGFLLDRGIEQTRDPKAIVITPSRNYPLGYSLSLSRRLELLQWAGKNRCWIIEDDYDSDFRFDGPPLTAMHGLDTHQCVLYTGTFSRVLHPSIRLGYLVVPQHLATRFKRLKQYLDGGTSLEPQLALAEFMSDGHFISHLRRMKKRYAQRRSVLHKLIERYFGESLTKIDNDGGLHSVYLLPNNTDDTNIVDQANQQGLGIRALSRFYSTAKGKPGLVIGFASYNDVELKKAVLQLLEIHQKIKP